MLRSLLFALVMMLGIAAPCLAQETAEAFAKRIYDTQFPKGSSDGPSITDAKHRKAFFTGALAAAIKKDEDTSNKNNEVGALDFDPVSNSQDPQVKEVRTRLESQGGDRATVVASFTNGGPERRDVFYDLTKQDDGWRIDDIRAAVEGDAWSLRDLLDLPKIK